MSMQCIPHSTPLLNRKTGVCRVIPNLLIFDPKHTLYPQCMFLGKILKISFFSNENFQFLQLKKKLYITWTCFRNEVASQMLSFLK